MLICLVKITSAHLHKLLSANLFFYNPQTYTQIKAYFCFYLCEQERPKKKDKETLSLNYPCMFFWKSLDKLNTNLVLDAVADDSMAYLERHCLSLLPRQPLTPLIGWIWQLKHTDT